MQHKQMSEITKLEQNLAIKKIDNKLAKERLTFSKMNQKKLKKNIEKNF